jgi:hypothetical protein
MVDRNSSDCSNGTFLLYRSNVIILLTVLFYLRRLLVEFVAVFAGGQLVICLFSVH